jgi:hypothetical protein
MNKFSRLSLISLLLITVIAAQGQRTSVKSRRLEPRQKGQAIPQAPEKWHTFTGPDGDFIILFPAEPKRDKDLPGDVAVLRGYSYYGNSLWLSVSFEDLGYQTDSRQANDLGPKIDEIMARYTEGRGGKTLRVQRLDKNILEEERVVPSKWSNKERHVISRIIYSNSRLYSLGCVPLVDGQEVDKRTCRRFFNSFRIIGIPQ